LDVIFNVVLKC